MSIWSRLEQEEEEAQLAKEIHPSISVEVGEVLKV